MRAQFPLISLRVFTQTSIIAVRRARYGDQRFERKPVSHRLIRVPLGQSRFEFENPSIQ
jgi:hypothetical protein